MARKITCCYECENRRPLCHDRCEAYQKQKQQREKEKELERKGSMIYAYMHDRRNKYLKQAKDKNKYMPVGK